MVTIAISEEDSIVSDLLKTALSSKGHCFNQNISDTDSEYLLLLPKTHKQCDVLLLHELPLSQATEAEYITIINADKTPIPIFDRKSLVITYGLNPLATVTASSVLENPEQTDFLCCLQRSIVTLKGKVIEPQEFPVSLPSTYTDISAAMGVVCLGLVLSFVPKDFRFCFFPKTP